eukprot:gb/GECG01015156.1/.p1 GENE.gb/GECG01015156.1/~~gb/GECG01015156.1/.p1  ORF type:complete len:746 (+),score=107.54 gb/GECG01015156.1/:1-2238(+)
MEHIDEFNDKLGAAFEALSSKHFYQALQYLIQLRKSLSKAKHSIHSSSRRQQSRNTGVSSSSVSAGAAGGRQEDPLLREYNARMETIQAVEEKLKHTVLEEKKHVEVDHVEKLKEIWSVAAQLGDTDVNEWFSRLVVDQFRETSFSILKKLDTMTTLKGVSNKHGSSAAASGGDDPNQEGWAAHPEVAALVELLGEASTWITQVMEEKAPHRARSIVVTALHEESCTQSLKIIQKFCEGKEVVEFLRTVRESRHNDSIDIVSKYSDKEEKDEKWKKFDEVLDQYSFVLQVAERYLRLVTVSLSLGTMAEGSKLRCPLTKRCQEMISDYVMMEQTFISDRSETVLKSSVEITTENGFSAASWPDDLFFVVYKSICRSASTHNVMACAACSNNAVQHLTDCTNRLIQANAAYCDSSSGTPSGLSVLENLFSETEQRQTESSQSNGGPQDDIEGDLHAALSALLRDDDSSYGKKSEEQSGKSPSKQVKKASKPSRLPSRTLCCLNSMAMAKEFSTELVFKFTNEVNRVFPRTGVDSTNSNDEDLRPEFEYSKSELQQVSRKFSNGLNSCSANFVKSVFVPQIFRVREIITVADYQTQDVSILERTHSDLTDVVHNLIMESRCSLITQYLIDDAVIAVWQSFCDLVANEIMQGIHDNQFTEVGGLRLHQECDKVNTVLKSMVDTSTTNQEMQKLLQLTKVLSVERVTDLYTLYFPKSRISRKDVETIVSQRTDLQVRDIEWEKIPIKST